MALSPIQAAYSMLNKRGGMVKSRSFQLLLAKIIIGQMTTQSNIPNIPTGAKLCLKL
jgi:hypothetical protein